MSSACALSADPWIWKSHPSEQGVSRVSYIIFQRGEGDSCRGVEGDHFPGGGIGGADFQLYGKRGNDVSRDGGVNVEIFEEARKEAQQLFHELLDGLDEPTPEKLRRSWPLREGKFLCESELSPQVQSPISLPV